MVLIISCECSQMQAALVSSMMRMNYYTEIWKYERKHKEIACLPGLWRSHSSLLRHKTLKCMPNFSLVCIAQMSLKGIPVQPSAWNQHGRAWHDSFRKVCAQEPLTMNLNMQLVTGHETGQLELLKQCMPGLYARK